MLWEQGHIKLNVLPTSSEHVKHGAEPLRMAKHLTTSVVVLLTVMLIADTARVNLNEKLDKLKAQSGALPNDATLKAEIVKTQEAIAKLSTQDLTPKETCVRTCAHEWTTLREKKAQIFSPRRPGNPRTPLSIRSRDDIKHLQTLNTWACVGAPPARQTEQAETQREQARRLSTLDGTPDLVGARDPALARDRHLFAQRVEGGR